MRQRLIRTTLARMRSRSLLPCWRAWCAAVAQSKFARRHAAELGLASGVGVPQRSASWLASMPKVSVFDAGLQGLGRTFSTASGFSGFGGGGGGAPAPAPTGT